MNLLIKWYEFIKIKRLYNFYVLLILRTMKTIEFSFSLGKRNRLACRFSTYHYNGNIFFFLLLKAAVWSSLKGKWIYEIKIIFILECRWLHFPSKTYRLLHQLPRFSLTNMKLLIRKRNASNSISHASVSSRINYTAILRLQCNNTTWWCLYSYKVRHWAISTISKAPI